MVEALSVQYFFDVFCLSLAFFTFIKLLGSQVYLNKHRIVPVIGAVITMRDFYIVIMPFMRNSDQIELLSFMCHLCGIVILFMMLCYAIFMTKPKHGKVFVAVNTQIMVLACLNNALIYHKTGTQNFTVSAIITVVCVTLGSTYTFLNRRITEYRERTDRIINIIMRGLLYFSVACFALQNALGYGHFFITAGLAIDCAFYYYFAGTNRIEDPTTIMTVTLFDLIEYPVCLVNTDFYITNVNKAGIELFPAAKGIEFAFEGNDFRGKFILGQHLVSYNENDKEYYTSSGWHRLHWTEVRSEGKLKGYIFTTTDVSAQHEQMQAAREETAEKAQFLAHMSHELRSPLHAINGVAEILLSKHDISTKNKNLITHIKKASVGLLELVNAILDYSKLESGKFSFVEKRYDIDEMLEGLTLSNIINLQSKPVDLNVSVTTDFPRYLYGDMNRVREIFQNLLGNAVKFTDSGSINAELSFEELEGDKYKINFKVRDTGIGMSPEQIKEIFNEYVTLANGAQIEGTGLGLNISSQIIELLGGKINAYSDGMSGSEFSGFFIQNVGGDEILSPRIYNRTSVTTKSMTATLAENRPEWIYPDAKLLIADDMKINLEILKQLLEPWQCRVKAVSNGQEAIDAVKEEEFNLILLDHMMSPVDGIEAAREIKKLTQTPIVLVTANMEDNVRKLMFEAGISDYLGKPISTQNIQIILDKYMPTEFRQKDLLESSGPGPRRDLHNIAIYQKTLETYVKEMEPLLLHLPGYEANNRDMFKIKVHGIKGVSRQIGRETFADQAEIMEMAAKADHWSYVEKHLDEFLDNLCAVIEDVTLELTKLAPDVDTLEENIVREDKEVADKGIIRENFEKLLEAFDAFDISKIEIGINSLENLELPQEESRVYSQLIDAYDNLEYENGSEVLTEYLNNN